MNREATSGMRRNERGQALIEFGLLFLFLISLVISILEMSLFLYNYSVLTDAAKEGVRYAVVHGSSAGASVSSDPESAPWPPCTTSADDNVFNAVHTYMSASAHKLAPLSVYLCYPEGNNNPGSAVQVTVSYPYDPLSAIGPLNWAAMNIPVSATSVGRIQF